MRNSTLIPARIALIGLVSSSAWAVGASYSPHKFQQNDWFAEFGQGGAQYVNPAMMTEVDQVEGSLALFKTLNYQAGQNYLNLAVPVDYKHTFGFTFFNNGSDIGTGAEQRPYTENAYMFGYAYRPIHHLSIGANLNVLHINQFNLSQEVTPGVDLGLTWNPIADSRYGFLLAGIAVQNVLQPVVNTSSEDKTFFQMQYLSKEANTYAVPMNVNASLFWRGNVFGSHRNMEVKAEGSLIDVKHVKTEGGVEDPFQKMEMSFSATYYLNYMLGLKARLTKEGYPVIGSTVNMKDLNVFKYLQWDLEMSHDDIRPDSKNRGFILATKLTTRVGPTREESIGFERYERLKLEPERDFKRAMQLYLNRNFLEASYAFGKVITKYPAFHLVDQAALYKGKAFENMQMHRAARETYKEAMLKYSFSDRVAEYKLRMMSIDYKEGKFDEALAKYQEILSNFSQSEVKTDADYIAGQIRFNQGQFQQAIDLLKGILPGNGNYMYARYTMAIAHSRLNQFDKASLVFQDILQGRPANKSEANIQDAARVKLAHVYFSQQPQPRLTDAAKLYREVNKDAPVYDEAMLGIAWTFLKGNQAANAIKVAEGIIKQLPDSYMVPEAWLVKGYAQYMLAKGNVSALQDARASLEKCKSMIEKPVISASQKDSAQRVYNSNISSFEGVQDKVQFLSKQLPTQRVQQKRDALKPDFAKAMTSIEDYTDFLKRMEESRQFEENRKKLLSDATYTLAIISSKMGKSGGSSGPAKSNNGDTGADPF